MSDTALDSAELDLVPVDTSTGAPKLKSRTALLKRLADVICLPASRVNAFERAVTADLMVEILQQADAEERARVSRRLSSVTDIPPLIARLLMRDRIETAEPLLAQSQTLNDCELLDCIASASEAHRRLIAGRRVVNEVVCEALVGGGEAGVVEILLRNEGARLSHSAIETLVAMSRSARAIIPPLLRRSELRPSHAYVLFWWADAQARRIILQRFAVSREILQEAASDVFAMAAAEGWSDALSRKALQFIERRQRNRDAIPKSPFASLEEAIAAAEQRMTPDLVKEIAYLSGLKPMTAAKILADQGGEPMAILCKSTGLPKSALRALWRAMRRADIDAHGDLAPDFERVTTIFDMIAVDRAQTVLRYWNWALSSAMTPALLEAIRSGDDRGIDEFSTPARAAMLTLGPDLGR